MGFTRLKLKMFVAAMGLQIGLAFAQAGPATAPQKGSATTATPHFTSNASLVLIPTVVTDRNGEHVAGLTKDDFYVTENHQAQKITVFEEIKTQPGQIRRVTPQDAGFTNAVAAEAKSQRLTMILLDTLNTRFQDQVHARRELLKFVDETLQPDEPVALLSIGTNGLNVINDFTTDPKVLSAAVKKVRGQLSTKEQSEFDLSDLEALLQLQRQSGRGPVTQDMIVDELDGFQNAAFEHFDRFQTANGIETTLRALQQIALSFSGVPGRKSLIWATGGLPFIVDDPNSFDFRHSQLEALYESTWNALNDAQITVYPLDMGGLFNPGFVSPRFRRPTRRLTITDSVANLESFAKMTGGKLCEYKLSMSGCFGETQKDASQYYLLGYYTDTKKGKTGWRRLDVVVQRPQAQVRARTSFFVPTKPSDPKTSEQREVEMAVVSPSDFTAVPLLVRWTGKFTEGAQVKLNFRFNVPSAGVTIDQASNNLVDLTFAAFAKTEQGGIAGTFAKAMEGNLPAATAEQVAAHGVIFDGAIAVSPGKYAVRFVVRDNLSGRLGTVTVPLETEHLAVTKQAGP